jgi:tripartite-type tricarboxylate transporter receptor subunit TctC
MTSRAFLAATLLVAAANAAAQEFPTKPIRILVGFTPGGGADIAARFVAQKFTETWARPAVVDNRPGAGGNVAFELTVKAPADGHTLIVAPGPFAPGLYAKLPFDLRKDFVAVTQIARAPMILVVHPSVPASNVKALLALARAKPGILTYGSSGLGLTPHLATELLSDMAKVRVAHIPYKGAAPAMLDVVAGRVDMLITSVPTAIGQIKSGRLKALAVTSIARAPLLPDVPTVDESGLPGYRCDGWWGLLGPAAMPQDIVAKLNTTLVRGLNDPELRRRYAEEGGEVVASSPADFWKFFTAEIDKWDGVLRKAGVKPQ